MKTFQTHTGKTITGQVLQTALNSVANDWRELGYAIKKENAYASHVSEEIKEKDLQNMLNESEQIKQGNINSFTIWQRVNEKLTGKCIAFLPK